MALCISPTPRGGVAVPRAVRRRACTATPRKPALPRRSLPAVSRPHRDDETWRTYSATGGEASARAAPAPGGYRASAVDDFAFESPPWVVRGVDLLPGEGVGNTASDELRDVAALQAEAFHKGDSPLGFMNDMGKKMFKAEVLDALKRKAVATKPGEYVCLVARNAESGSVEGVVEVTRLEEADVQAQMGLDSYLYVSCMAVREDCRRQGVGTVLLEAADAIASEWGDDQGLVLHVHDDNEPAVALYTRNGYEIQGQDPEWSTKWLGKDRRLLMARPPSQ